ncbi:MAG: SDR family oxidoreductase [Ahrensia sp.]|nr:SDR family oxidoreductase [Ahrensia sp.]
MKTVLVAGATGYLGRNIVKYYMAQGWLVRALVRDAEKARSSGLDATEFFEGEGTEPESLIGVMDGVDLVISALGITRQRDGLDYRQVDFQANANLLTEAESADVIRFAYVHVLNAKAMKGVPMVDAKQAFVDRLQASALPSTVICPSGFFSDMADFYTMSKAGRVWLFGDGSIRMNPIDGADLASAIGHAIEQKREFVEIGGPDILSHREIAELAFAVRSKPVRITNLPDIIRRAAIHLLPFVTPKHIHGPALMFLKAMGMHMVGEIHGTKHLNDHFGELARHDAEAPRQRSSISKEVQNAH